MDIRDLVDPAELVGVVRQLQFPRFALAGILPEVNRQTIDYSFLRGNADTLSAAPVRAYDAEAPIGRRPGATRMSGQLPPISQKIPLTEGERLMLEELTRSSGATPEIVEAIFADAARMVRAVKARVELARGDVLTDGIVTINENGMQFTVDFGVPAAHKVVAAASWANPATDILGDISAWVETYIDTNGVPPERILTSSQVIAYMLRNEGIGVVAGPGGLLGDEQLNQLFIASGLPPVTRYDLQVHNSAGVKQRVIPADRFIMLPGEDDIVGQTQYGTTAEALELAGEGLLPIDDAPGVVATTWKSKDPVQVWTKGAGIALPLLFNPDLLFTADVTP